ncbi:MAG: hypothetical protein WD793_09950 [Steroidobacteraceae bacterium]
MRRDKRPAQLLRESEQLWLLGLPKIRTEFNFAIFDYVFCYVSDYGVVVLDRFDPSEPCHFMPAIHPGESPCNAVKVAIVTEKGMQVNYAALLPFGRDHPLDSAVRLIHPSAPV